MLSAPPNWDLPPLPALLIKAAGLALPPLIRAARLSRLPEKTHIWFVVLSPAPFVVETRPTNLDLQQLKELFREYGGRVYEEKTDEIFRSINLAEAFKTPQELTERAYRQPFGTFEGELPGGVKLERGYGVMESHDVWW